ncbi:MAG: beta-lactamase family protein, partial [Bacteroidetes bacterium]|nr:beta-lactamase family protein [Bacteroidota bacterium]
IVAFDPDGSGWSVIANDKFRTRLPKDEIETFEGSVGGKTIWQRMRDANVPGVSVAVVINNQLAWSTGYGHLADGADAAAHPESMYQAASISKVVTAIGIHQLVDQGLINLTSDIQNNLSVNIPARNCLTGNPAIILSDVLTHQSSVMGRSTTFPLDSCSNFGSGGGGYGGYASTGSLPTLNQIITGTGNTNSSPITRSRNAGSFSYSGDGYTLLQKLVEDLTNQSFSTWMRDNVLVPTGMDDSYFQTALPQKYFDSRQVAAGHDTNGNRIDGDRRRYPEFAAAGLYCSAEDLARMVIMLNNNGTAGNNQVLSQTSRNNLVQNGIGVFRSDGSINANNNFYTHGGTNAGFKAIFLGFPSINAGIVVMTNGDSNVSNFRSEVAQAVINAYGW